MVTQSMLLGICMSMASTELVSSLAKMISEMDENTFIPANINYILKC